jgi:two-component system cell cycle response regulator DivK
MKILVVEDNEDNRPILALRLRQLGEVDIKEAASGQEALDWITREPPDAVFLNLQLPVLDGWETARRIHALPAPLSRLPSIAVTAYAMVGDRAKALAAGVTSILPNRLSIRRKSAKSCSGCCPALPNGRRRPFTKT